MRFGFDLEANWSATLTLHKFQHLMRTGGDTVLPPKNQVAATCRGGGNERVRRAGADRCPLLSGK